MNDPHDPSRLERLMFSRDTISRIELVQYAGKPINYQLTWVWDHETERWYCFRAMPGVNQYGRVVQYDRVILEDVFALMKALMDASGDAHIHDPDCPNDGHISVRSRII